MYAPVGINDAIRVTFSAKDRHYLRCLDNLHFTKRGARYSLRLAVNHRILHVSNPIGFCRNSLHFGHVFRLVRRLQCWIVNLAVKIISGRGGKIGAVRVELISTEVKERRPVRAPTSNVRTRTSAPAPESIQVRMSVGHAWRGLSI